MAALCPSRTGIDRVAVVDALADGEALDDLDAHRGQQIGRGFCCCRFGLLVGWCLPAEKVLLGGLAGVRLQERSERSMGETINKQTDPKDAWREDLVRR